MKKQEETVISKGEEQSSEPRAGLTFLEPLYAKIKIPVKALDLIIAALVATLIAVVVIGMVRAGEVKRRPESNVKKQDVPDLVASRSFAERAAGFVRCGNGCAGGGTGMKNGTIHIRPYEKADFGRMEQIHDPARQKELALAGLSDAFVPLAIAAEREDLFAYQVYVAEYEGETAGFVAFAEGEIAWLYVDERLTRRGIGRALLGFALEKAGPHPEIEVLAGNAPAIALYQSFGFHIRETLTGVMPGNEAFPVTVHVMERPETATDSFFACGA